MAHGGRREGAGRPKGSLNERPFANALRMEMAAGFDAKSPPDTYRQLARKLMSHASNGESWAFREIIDRLDGKPVQQTENHNVNENTFAYVTEVSSQEEWKEMIAEIRESDPPVRRAKGH